MDPSFAVQSAASGMVSDVMAVVLPGGSSRCGIPGMLDAGLGVEVMAEGLGSAEQPANPAANTSSDADRSLTDPPTLRQ